MKLKEQMERKIRLQGKSPQTFETYWHWCESFILWLRADRREWIHPASVGRDDVEAWLTWLACDEQVAKNTQNLALQSVCYLYKYVLCSPLENVSAIRAKRPEQVRDCISVEEVARLFAEMEGLSLLVARLIYATGLRIGKVMDLRIKDISFEREQLMIKTAKGDKGRYVQFPAAVHPEVRKQIESARNVYLWDCANNPHGVSLPNAYRRKSPRASLEWPWYFLFPSDRLSRDKNGPLCRHHRQGDHFTKQIKAAAQRAGIEKRVTSHILRHSYATHTSELGTDVTVIQQLLGHSDIRTTMIYVHANKHRATAARSPIAELAHHLANPSVAAPLKIVG